MTVVGICLNISVLIGVDRIGLQGYIVEKVANTLDSTTVNCRHKPQNSRSVSYWQWKIVLHWNRQNSVKGREHSILNMVVSVCEDS